MKYEIGYVSCSLFVLLIVGYRFFKRKKVHTIKNVFFGAMILLGIAEIIVDIISAFMTSYFDSFTYIPVLLINQLFYLFQFALPFLTYLFVFGLTDGFKDHYKTIFYNSIPLLISLVAWLLNPFIHTLFYIDSMGVYHRANTNLIVYISALYYLLAAAITSYSLRNKIGKTPSIIMIFGPIVCIAVVFYQFLIPEKLMTGVGIMATELVMYLYLNNSDSVIDPLTDCFERSALDQYLDGGLMSKQDGFGLAVSLTNFSNVNNVYGIEVGDEVLKKTGHFMIDLAEDYDTNAYRLMPDIFFIPYSNKNDYLESLDYLRVEVEKPFIIDNLKVDVETHIFKLEDISYNEKNSDLTALMRYAINESKKKEMAKEILLDHHFKEEYEFNSTLGLYLKEAIDDKKFYMEYQPIYSLKDKKFNMLEALIRLEHPVYGRIVPDTFITVAEKLGLISSITDLVLDMVSDFISTSNLNKLGVNNVKVNLSAIDLLDADLPSRIDRVLNKKNVDNNILGFEITETVATTLNEETNNFLNYAKERNFSLSMDDFGSGYANLSNATRINFDVIKLDRSMLLGADDSKAGKETYKTLIKLFQKLDCKTVSEGAESEDEVKMLEKWGTDYIQGYYYSKPLSKDKVIEFLKKNNNS